jgi:anti-sigma B factor antagonist
MKYQVESEGEVPLIRVAGELDAVTVPQLRNVFQGLEAQGHRRLVLDLSGLRLIDSTGVGVLLSLHRRLETQGGGVAVRGLRSQPLLVFQLLRLDRVLLHEQSASV